MQRLLVSFEFLDQQMEAFAAQLIGRARAQLTIVTDHRIQLLTFPAHRQPSPTQDNRFAADRVPCEQHVAVLQSAHAGRCMPTAAAADTSALEAEVRGAGPARGDVRREGSALLAKQAVVQGDAEGPPVPDRRNPALLILPLN